MPDKAHLCVEYECIHNNRIHWVNSLNQWYRLGLGGSLAAYGFFITTSVLGEKQQLLLLGTAFATGILWFCVYSALKIDKAVVGLYPRIVALEIFLGFDFYLTYLKNTKNGGTENRFVTECLQLSHDDFDQFWQQVKTKHQPQDFPSTRRNHRGQILASVMLTLIYIFFSMSVTMTFK